LRPIAAQYSHHPALHQLNVALPLPPHHHPPHPLPKTKLNIDYLQFEQIPLKNFTKRYSTSVTLFRLKFIEHAYPSKFPFIT